MPAMTEQQKITFLCTNCGEIVEETIDVTISAESSEVVAFDSDIYIKCPNCGATCIEVPDMMASAISKLYKKGYTVIKSDQGRYDEVLYAPNIQIECPVKLDPPKGWEYAAECDPSGVHKVLVPVGSFGTIKRADVDSSKNMEQYKTTVIFPDEETFLKRQAHYIKRLEQWVDELPVSYTLMADEITGKGRGATGEYKK